MSYTSVYTNYIKTYHNEIFQYHYVTKTADIIVIAFASCLSIKAFLLLECKICLYGHLLCIKACKPVLSIFVIKSDLSSQFISHLTGLSYKYY